MRAGRSITLMAVLIPMVVALTSAGRASATELYSPSVFLGDSTSCVICSIVNTTAIERIVRIQILNSSGVVRHDTGNVTLAANGDTQDGMYTGSNNNTADYFHCHFTVNAAKATVRAQIVHNSTCTSNGSFALPAQ